MQFSKKNIFNSAWLFLVFSISVPILANAYTFKDFVDTVAALAKDIVVLLVGVAVLGVLVGILRYISAGADEKKLSEAKKIIVYGIIALAVIVSMWGLVSIIRTTFGI